MQEQDVLIKKRFIYYEVIYWRVTIVCSLLIILGIILTLAGYIGVSKSDMVMNIAQLIPFTLGFSILGVGILIVVFNYLILFIKKSKLMISIAWKRRTKTIVYSRAFKKDLWKVNSIYAYCEKQKVFNQNNE